MNQIIKLFLHYRNALMPLTLMACAANSIAFSYILLFHITVWQGVQPLAHDRFYILEHKDKMVLHLDSLRRKEKIENVCNCS